jgi:hypothetical protein
MFSVFLRLTDSNNPFCNVIGTGCLVSCKSNYHTITTMTASAICNVQSCTNIYKSISCISYTISLKSKGRIYTGTSDSNNPFCISNNFLHACYKYQEYFSQAQKMNFFIKNYRSYDPCRCPSINLLYCDNYQCATNHCFLW